MVTVSHLLMNDLVWRPSTSGQGNYTVGLPPVVELVNYVGTVQLGVTNCTGSRGWKLHCRLGLPAVGVGAIDRGYLLWSASGRQMGSQSADVGGSGCKA